VVYSIEMGDSGEGSGVDFSKSSKTVAYGVLNEFASKLKASDYPDGLGFAIHSTRDWYDLKVS
ncbi:MAG: hypothetical protein J6Z00_00165, partial [Clostridia bacterium]|nr:hypothetical protein [Clostridia bacterium]